MLILRFQRQGKKKDFIFRIVAVDSKIAVNSGKSTEILGWLNPKTNKFELKKDRILYWLNQGAQVSDSCYNLLVKAKIIEGKKRPIKITKKKAKKGESSEEVDHSQKEAPIGEKPVEETQAGGKQIESVEETKEKLAEDKSDKEEKENKEDKKEETEKEKKVETEAKEEQTQETQPETKKEKEEISAEELKEEKKEKVEEKSDLEKPEK
ncbi:MAG: 30S ribosomal protein S16 [Candidatus Pacebacteria bacterium]|jgi:small subunit ribosomal protein S16|nr:30S ribosomal protein S16 [Candidatus Paceibacterota bacterium]MDD4994498.1 30S ribosomal protein S16 [Candidatus Paceibacterota bacterium]MDD5535397.1 30S ribosomal protein S16 [Candidatus Paceibacterota bacterium]